MYSAALWESKLLSVLIVLSSRGNDDESVCDDVEYPASFTSRLSYVYVCMCVCVTVAMAVAMTRGECVGMELPFVWIMPSAALLPIVSRPTESVPALCVLDVCEVHLFLSR